MKLILPISAAVLALSACDGEKVQEAKQKAADAGKAAGAFGEAGKEIVGKSLEKVKELSAKAGEKTKELVGAAGEKAKELTDSAGQIIKEEGGPAMEAFKARIGGFSEWSRNSRATIGGDLNNVKAYMAEMNSRLSGIPAEGLPAELKSALTAYQASMAKFQQMFRNSPADEAGITKWSQDNADALHKIELEWVAAAKNLQEAAAAHGVTGLDLGSLSE